MIIKLQSLTLHNFRGVRDLTVELRGENASISGPNAAGKTSIVDAFHWLLFNKNSEDQGKFEIKTLDADNNPIHNLDHEVEAVLTADGKRVTLRKLYKEKWTRPRGKSQQEFEGHTTDYWVNDEPYKAKDYNAYISGLVDDETFRLITNPLYFSTKIHWEQRRKTLLALCGEVQTDDIVAACFPGDEDARVKLSGLLEERTIEAARKVLQDRRRKVNDELEKIPSQIEAVTRTIPELRDNYAEIEASLVVCRDELATLDTQMQDASRALEPIRAKGRELSRLEQELATIKARMERESRAGYEDAKQNRSRLDSQLQRAKNTVAGAKVSAERLNDKVSAAERELVTLREEHETAYIKAYEPPSADELICRACGQDLPADKRDQLLSDAQNRFESQKSISLQAIKDKGTRAKAAYEAAVAEREAIRAELDEAETARDRIAFELEQAALAEKELAPTGTVDYTSDPQYASLTAQIAALSAELETPPEDTTATISAQRAAVNARMEGFMKALASRDAALRSREIIAEYTARERELSDQVAELDGQLAMLESYVRTEAELLESAINSKFRTIRFKLFEEQINGGLRPTCEALVDGVPFGNANDAAKVNAGMEIIDALCEHYIKFAPIFVDKCESINSLISVASQVISTEVLKSKYEEAHSREPGVITHRGARGNLYVQLESSKKTKEVA